MDDAGTDRRPLDRSAEPFRQRHHPVPSHAGGTGGHHRKRQRPDKRVSRPSEKFYLHLPTENNFLAGQAYKVDRRTGASTKYSPILDSRKTERG